MRRLSHRPGAKVAAWLSLALALLLGVASGTAVAVLEAHGAYQDGGAYFRQTILEAYCAQSSHNVFFSYYPAVQHNDSNKIYWDVYFSPEKSNFYFTLTDRDGAVLLQNASTEGSQYTFEQTYDVPTKVQYNIREYYKSDEEAQARVDDLHETYYVESYSIDGVDLRYGVSCALEELEEPEDLDTAATDNGGLATSSVEPVEVVPDEDADEPSYSTYYFNTPEDRNRWLEQMYARYAVTVNEFLEDPSRYMLAASCYESELLNLTAQVPLHLTAMDGIYYRLALLQFLLDYQIAFIVVLAACAVLSLLLLLFLFCGAGRRAGQEGICLTWFDRIPVELLLLAGVGICSIPITIATESSRFWEALVALVCAVPATLGVILILMSFAARIKAHRWWRSTIVYTLFHWIRRVCTAVWLRLRFIIQGLPLVWQLALAWFLLSFVEMFFVVSNGGEGVWILERLVLTPALLITGIQLTRLRQGARRIADGDLSTQVNLKYMVGEIRRHGEDLNNITNGLQAAVDDRMRSERLKTELITNVSHDIKTPLTSIVNYVDLLSQEEMPSEAAREYLEVLQRQSARLRKLTEDLVEASKAATGNVETRPEPMDVNVLLTQTAGEFEEKLRALQLEPVLTLGEETAMIYADGRLLWRVFDNLMNNICKYALPGTRVYLSAQRKEDQVEIVFRNISRYPLNISSDELLERFVRGDASRSTEGSGLGLSIAKSLTDLQGGEFALTVDGDLFKATVRFPAL